MKLLRVPTSALCNLCVSLSLMSLVGCQPTATLEEIRQGRDLLAEGKKILADRATQFSNAMATLEVVEPLQALLTEPPNIPISQYYEDVLSKMYGTYTENALGTYDHILGISQTISVTKLNGISISVENLKYDQTMRLAQVDIKVRSNFNGIDTPTAEEMTIDVTQYRLNALGEILSPIQSAGLRMEGTAEFPAPTAGAPNIKIKITRSIGSLEDAGLFGTQSIQQGWRLILTDLTDGLINKKTLTEEKVVRYVPSDQNGVWVGEFAYDGFRGVGVFSDVRMVLQSTAVAASGLATYRPQGGVSSNGKKVALVDGGPWNCVVTNPTAIGSGTKIYLNWLDGQFPQDLLPSPTYTCEQTIINVAG